MHFQQNQPVILLVGDNSNNLKNSVFALEQAGNYVLTARDGCSAFLTAQRERPDLIISQISLADVSGIELCRLIRTDEELSATPFVLIGEAHQDDAKAAEILRAGADEYLSDSHTAQYLAIKAAWLIQQKHSEANLRQYCQILRQRQRHITEIIKDTSDLMRNLDYELEFTNFDEVSAQESVKLFGKKIELGINMVDSLAHLLEEQAHVLEIYERTSKGEDFDLVQESAAEMSKYDYYEIIS
ncbi:MAG: response regulator [Acidobacteriota bacterium]|nr:response regulator [Acidobacteriota bacterium]